LDRLTYTYYFSFNVGRERKGRPPHIRIPDRAEIEVSEYWYAVLKVLDRQEYNNGHAETRRHIVFDERNPKNLCNEENNPLFIMMEEEYTKAKAEAYYTLYDKILRGTAILTPKQQAAFTYRVLCQMPFKNVAYSMRFECRMNESDNSAKKHFYNAARKIREHFQKDYDRLKIFLRNF
jgi:hypothetical protein